MNSSRSNDDKEMEMESNGNRQKYPSQKMDVSTKIQNIHNYR